MNDLSSNILKARWVSEVEELLREALVDVELIGELPITEQAFKKICAALQEQCTKKGVDKNRLHPALFVVSLVFSGRYSHYETRRFWEPYANDVWGMKYSQSFRGICSSYFHNEAKADLISNFGFDFPTVNDGDVVRSVYWHTIIPSYLHDDFARWLSKNLAKISDLPDQYISEFVMSEAKYIAPTLQKFLTDEETNDMAIELIRELVAASDLLANHVDIDDIRKLFPSLILQEVWDKLVDELERDALVAHKSVPHARLQWVWSFEYEDWVLRLMNLNTKPSEQPTLCIWSNEPSDEAFWQNYYREDIWAEQQSDGWWRVREIMLGNLKEEEMLNAHIYVYDSNDNCIRRLDVPSLPNNEFQFYRLTQQRKYAIPIDYNQLSAGDWLVSYQNEFTLFNNSNLPVKPTKDDYYVSDVMRDVVRHTAISEYIFKLPIEIKTPTVQQRLERTKRRYLVQPILSTKHKIEGTSDRLPPIYKSHKVQLRFPEIEVATKYLKIHLTTPSGQLYEVFDDYAKHDGTGYVVDFSDLIPHDRIGTYEVDITYGFRSRLVSPIEFSVLPDFEVIAPANTIFHPLNLPSVTLKGMTTHSITLPNNKDKVETVGDETVITWSNLHTNYCYLRVHDDERVVSIEWKIERVFAWVENSVIPNRLVKDDLDKAKIHFRGQPKQVLSLYVDDDLFEVHLNARGEEVFNLYTDQFRDMLTSKSTDFVPVELKLDNGRWLFTAYAKRPQIKQLHAEYIVEEKSEKVLIDIKLSMDWSANFEVRVCPINSDTPLETIFVNTLDSLVLIPCSLPVGEYNIVVLANDKILDPPVTDILRVDAPTLISLDTEYDNSKSNLFASYQIDNLRLGEYQIIVRDEMGKIVSEKALDISYNDTDLSIKLYNNSMYTTSITWNGNFIGDSTQFKIETDELATSTTEMVSSNIKKSTQPVKAITATTISNNWLYELITAKPHDISPELLFHLTSIAPQVIATYPTNELAKLWRPIGRLAEVNQPEYWATKYGFIPTWALLDTALSMITDEGKSYLVFPELTFLRGASGIGKIALETPQEGKIYGYARWSKRTAMSSRLQVWIPPVDPEKSKYAELEELDMRPAYYDRLSGNFHGARDRYVIPGFNKAERIYLVDPVHTFTLRARTRPVDLQLHHSYWSRSSIDRYYTQALLQNRFHEVEKREFSRSKITEPEGYRAAVLEWANNYIDDKSLKRILKKLVSSNDIGGKLSEFALKLPRLAKLTNAPLIVGACRFLDGLEKQVTTDDESPLMALDRNLFVLAVILRAFVLPRQSIRNQILAEVAIDKAQLEQIVYDANLACPTLLEWALTWAEILTVHSSI